MLVLAGFMANSKKKKAAKIEGKVEELLYNKTHENIKKAEVLTKKAEALKAKAAEAEATIETKLDAIGSSNETIDAIADRWNSQRLRN